MEQPRLARRQRYSFIRRFRAKSSDMWSTRSLNFFNNDRQLAFACGTSPLRMFRTKEGRYRSGQTGQTVNLLALRLRWFESSPAQIPCRNGYPRTRQWPLRWPPPSRRPPYPPPPPYPPRPPPPGGRASRGRASFTVNDRPSIEWPLSFEMAF